MARYGDNDDRHEQERREWELAEPSGNSGRFTSVAPLPVVMGGTVAAGALVGIGVAAAATGEGDGGKGATTTRDEFTR